MGFSQEVASMFGTGAGFGSGDPDSTSNSQNTTNIQGGVGAGAGLAGLGLEIFGAVSGSSAASSSAHSGMAIAGLEQQENAKRQQAMQIVARRQQLQVIRTNQMAQAQARAAATNQGAQFGSGLQGGLSGIEAQSASNLQGINQQLDIGNSIFGLDAKISQQKMAQYQSQSDQATASGIGAIGGALLKAAPTIASLLV